MDLAMRSVCMQIGNHLNKRLDVTRQGDTVVIQLGVGCHVLGLYRSEPIDETAFAERVTTLGKTESMQSGPESPAYRVKDRRIRAPHGKRAHLA